MTLEEAEARWRAERRTFIGGSDLYRLFGIEQYQKGCERELAYEKLGVEPEYERTPEDEALLRRGHLLEPVAAAIYEEQTGRKVALPQMDEFGFARPIRHKKLPFLAVHADRYILPGYAGVEQRGALELKSHGEGMYLRIKRVGLPPGHSLQVQQALMIEEFEWGSLGMVGVFGSLPMEYVDFQADKKLHEQIEIIGTEFWNLIEKGQAPPPLPDKNDKRCKVCQFRKACRGVDVDPDDVAFMAKSAGHEKEFKTVDDPEIAADVAALLVIQEEIRVLKSDSDSEPGAVHMLKDKIVDDLKRKGIGTDVRPFFPGIGYLSMYESTTRSYIDEDKLQAEKPEIFKQYYVPGGMRTGNIVIRAYPIKLAKAKRKGN